VIGILNASMFGTPREPGEHVNWSRPDIMPRDDWYYLLGVPVEEYAATSPHMIVFEITTCPCGIRPAHDLTTQDGAERCRTMVEEIDRKRSE
jgi:hypothetical protein